MVEAVMIFGSGVVGLSVLTHMHTPPTVDFTMAGKPSHTLQFATSRFCCSSPRIISICLILFTHRLWADWVSCKHFILSPTVLKTHRCPIFVSSLCSVRSPPLSVCYSSHAQDFPGFTMQFFLCGFENGVAPFFTHGLICGFDIVDVHAPVGKL